MDVKTDGTLLRMQSAVFDMKSSPDVELIDRTLHNALSDSKGIIREMCSHLLSAGGKRIRPLLVLYCGLLFEGGYEDGNASMKIINTAAAAELIHMASLVHDDVIDGAPMRRNKPSVNNRWGNAFAVLCGDYLFAKAFGVLSGGLETSMGYMVDAIQNMCMGEILQAGDRFDLETNMDRYLDRIVKKTALFISSCCKSGAAAAGVDSDRIRIVGDFGLNLGIAFQILDDILDFHGSTDLMGKPKYEDIREGNITLPLILLLSNPKYGDRLEEIMDERDFSGRTLEQVRDMMDEAGIITRSFDMVKSYVAKALDSLELLPDSSYRRRLREMAVRLQTRAN